MTRRTHVLVSMVFGCAMLMAQVALAQSAGVRAGVSIDPNQFYFGGHYETGPLVEQLHFRPNIEIGLGDNVTVVALNLEFAYKFPARRDWSIYAGGGPALNIIDTDVATNTEGGFNLLFGAAHERGLFAELKIGLLDSPDVKLGVGYQFRWR
jgi:hypothetical protein